MTQIKNPITVVKSGGGGTVNIVNGIVDSFKANSSTIDANTFVDFIESSLNSSDNVIDSTSNAGNTKVGSALIDSDKVFVVYNLGTTIYAVVCTISGTTITVGTATTIATDAYSSSRNAVVKIENNKVFVTYNKQSAQANLYAVVCTISGTTITVGTAVYVSGSSITSYATTALSSSNVAIAYRRSSNLYTVVCTISGTTITVGTAATIATTYSSSTPGIFAYDANTIVVTYMSSTSPYSLYAVVCTISGTTITVGTATTIASNTNIVYKTSISGIQQGAVVVAFSNYISSSSSNLYTVVCTISGTTITAGEVTMIAQLSAQASYTQPIISMINNSMAVVVTRNSNTGLRYFFLKVAEKSTVATGELRTISTTNQYAEESISVIDSSNIVIFHGVGSSNTVLRGFVSEVPDFLVSVPDRSTGGSIKGLTKTACSTSSAGEVWALK